nr:hypothetical protein SrhCFBP13529_05550 [Stenotrophomonas rhizophila]
MADLSASRFAGPGQRWFKLWIDSRFPFRPPHKDETAAMSWSISPPYRTLSASEFAENPRTSLCATVARMNRGFTG